MGPALGRKIEPRRELFDRVPAKLPPSRAMNVEGGVLRESKGELTTRLRREGKWESFVRRREQLKTEGVPPSEAWFQAAAEFPAENPVRAIEPFIEWEDARASVEAARTDSEWLLAAMYVKLPPGIGSSALRGMLERMRASPRLLDEFYRVTVNRWAEREDREAAATPRTPLTMKDILG